MSGSGWTMVGSTCAGNTIGGRTAGGDTMHLYQMVPRCSRSLSLLGTSDVNVTRILRHLAALAPSAVMTVLRTVALGPNAILAILRPVQHLVH